VTRECEDFFIKVKEWRAFEGPDIEGNGLRKYVDGIVPGFVVEFERELDGKPVWPLMCVVSLTTLLMLTGQCRYMMFSNLSSTFNLWTHILGLSREGPSKTDEIRVSRLATFRQRIRQISSQGDV
jgi:hypothetical protein